MQVSIEEVTYYWPTADARPGSHDQSEPKEPLGADCCRG